LSAELNPALKPKLGNQGEKPGICLGCRAFSIIGLQKQKKPGFEEKAGLLGASM
jgi:hypothetical protein